MKKIIVVLLVLLLVGCSKTKGLKIDQPLYNQLKDNYDNISEIIIGSSDYQYNASVKVEYYDELIELFKNITVIEESQDNFNYDDYVTFNIYFEDGKYCENTFYNGCYYIYNNADQEFVYALADCSQLLEKCEDILYQQSHKSDVIEKTIYDNENVKIELIDAGFNEDNDYYIKLRANNNSDSYKGFKVDKLEINGGIFYNNYQSVSIGEGNSAEWNTIVSQDIVETFGLKNVGQVGLLVNVYNYDEASHQLTDQIGSSTYVAFFTSKHDDYNIEAQPLGSNFGEDSFKLYISKEETDINTNLQFYMENNNDSDVLFKVNEIKYNGLKSQLAEEFSEIVVLANKKELAIVPITNFVFDEDSSSKINIEQLQITCSAISSNGYIFEKTIDLITE